MKTLLVCFGFLFAFIVAHAVGAEPPAKAKKEPSMSLEEIAAMKSLDAVERVAKNRAIPYDIQTTATLRAQASPEYASALRFGAEGRLGLTFWLRETEGVVVTSHVSFFFNKSGYILGRTIVLENNNKP